jgi:hypothetical protein
MICNSLMEIKKQKNRKKERVGLPLEENRRSPFENLLVFLLHGATGLDLSQPFKKRGKIKYKYSG